MTDDNSPPLPWDTRVIVDDALAEDQAAALELALGDGFETHGMRNGVRHPLAGLVDEPYFGANVGTGEAVPIEPEFFDRLRSEGVSEDEILEEFEWYIDSLNPDDAPSWRGSNPFCFDLKSIREYFIAEFCSLMELDSSDYHLIDYVGNLTEDFNPYTRIWFIIQILTEIELFDFCLKDSKKRSAVSSVSMLVAIGSLGTVGRMVEHYRWRFTYGPDALRGRANLSAARAGGIQRARSYQEKKRALLARMAEFVSKGHTVSNAANLTFKAGLGTSAEANRKHWNRRPGKK